MELNPNLSLKAQQDIELVEKAKKGDQLAYGELLGRYRDAIYFMLLKMVNSPVDAEDLTIEAFGKAFNSPKSEIGVVLLGSSTVTVTLPVSVLTDSSSLTTSVV